MAYETTRRVLGRVRDFHNQLSEYYAGLSDGAARERVKKLLDYLSQRERSLEAPLRRFEEKAANGVLDTWFRFTPDLSSCQVFEPTEIHPDMSIREVLRTALWFDDCLVDFYNRMAGSSNSREVRELFHDLADLEREKERRTALMAFAIEHE